jgi:hypothetical protein
MKYYDYDVRHLQKERETLRAENKELKAELAKAREASADDIRQKGWSVAIHNDYRLLGNSHTFWLFTKEGRAVKGEGRTDREALDIVRKQIESED